MYCTPTKILTARKPHSCTYCAEQIEVDEQYLRWMNVDNGKAVTNKMHPECLASLEESAYGGHFEYAIYEGERPPVIKHKGDRAMAATPAGQELLACAINDLLNERAATERERE